MLSVQQKTQKKVSDLISTNCVLDLVNGKKWIKRQKKSAKGLKTNEKLKYCLKEKRSCVGCML